MPLLPPPASANYLPPPVRPVIYCLPSPVPLLLPPSPRSLSVAVPPVLSVVLPLALRVLINEQLTHSMDALLNYHIVVCLSFAQSQVYLAIEGSRPV
jgi:hypothetical protein